MNKSFCDELREYIAKLKAKGRELPRLGDGIPPKNAFDAAIKLAGASSSEVQQSAKELKADGEEEAAAFADNWVGALKELDRQQEACGLSSRAIGDSAD